MNKLQERKASMHIVVDKGLDETPEKIIEKIPKFKFYHQSLKECIEEIEDFRKKQERNNTGTAQLKNTLKEKLVNSSLKMGRKITAFAIDEELQELQQMVNYSKTKLSESADTILIDRCKIIHDASFTNFEGLVPYGVTEVMIKNLNIDIENFKKIMPEPRLKITTKKDATDELGMLFKDTGKLLKKMDKVFEMIRDEHHDFYRNYKNNRILINPGAHPASVIGTVKNVAKEAMANVVIREPQTGLEITTGPRGMFRIKKMKPGNYEMLFTKNGFKEELVKIAINDKEITEVHVIMQPME
ncbi:carboxypeptidase-like regulatory domain-containing protein [Flavobacterium soli]|uniref:carboxypeptidase-like regulatory domain-containing protein n=1 Tax=Flavobacterium soli TaxID=344881 RepID=UPI0003FB50A8|nr:carboxypeptidase-like regulatory domain-containing protein [Flavobacterium soli]